MALLSGRENWRISHVIVLGNDHRLVRAENVAMACKSRLASQAARLPPAHSRFVLPEYLPNELIVLLLAKLMISIRKSDRIVVRIVCDIRIDFSQRLAVSHLVRRFRFDDILVEISLSRAVCIVHSGQSGVLPGTD